MTSSDADGHTPAATPAQGDLFRKCHAYQEWFDAQVEQLGFYPFFAAIQEVRGTTAVIDGRDLLMIGSNNYLGLSWDPRVREAAIAAVKRYGTSCSGSRYLNGTLTLHEELEADLADFVGRPAALCFTTGYQTNLGAISALLGKNDHVFSDRFNHASVMDGIFHASGRRLGTVKVHRYAHNSAEDLDRSLRSAPADAGKLVVTDGVFSMEGDIVRLDEITEVARRHGARVYLDEAHAIGVIGTTGRGTEEHVGRPLADLVMCTFSKTFGSIGGFVAGDREVVNYIKHEGRPLIFSASMPPANLAAAAAALKIMREEPEHAQRLQRISTRMIREYKALGFDVDVAETAIVPLIIGDDHLTFRFWRELFEAGIYANPVVTPGVPPGRALIRTSYMAIHTDDELDRVLEITATVGRRLGII